MSACFPLKMTFLGLLITLLSTLSGCDRLSNAYSKVKLDCGIDAQDDVDYVQILNPRGLTVTGTELLARIIQDDATAEPVAITAKGCVPLPKGVKTLVVTSPLADVPWGAVIATESVPDTRQWKLSDVSQTHINVQCPVLLPTKDFVDNPVVSAGLTSKAFPYRLTFIQNDVRYHIATAENGLLKLAVPSNFKQGDFRVEISYQNLFKASQAELQQQPIDCLYNLDTDAPALSDSLEASFTDDLFRVLPGEKITVRLEDVNSGTTYYCLETAEKRCASEADYLAAGSELTLQAPQSGEWCLYYYGEDKAANRSETLRRCGISYQASLIEQIRATADLALVRASQDKLIANALILRAYKLYLSLPTERERAVVRDKLASTILTIGATTSERFRTRWSEELLLVKKLGPYLALADRKGLSLLDPKTLSAQHIFPAENVVDVRLQGDRLLLATKSDFRLIRLSSESQSDVEYARQDWEPGFLDEGSVELHPNEDEVIGVSSAGKLMVYKSMGAGFRVTTRLSLWTGETFLWDKLAQRVLIRDKNRAFVLKRFPSGVYASDPLRDVANGQIHGAGYWSESDTFFVLIANQGFSFWTIAKGFVLAPTGDQGNLFAFAPNEAFRDRILDAGNGKSSYLALGESLYEAVRDGDSVRLDPVPFPDDIDLKRIEAWSFDGLRLHIYTSDVSYLIERRARESSWLIYQKVPRSNSPRKQSLFFPEFDRLITVDEDRRFTSWSRSSVFGSFQAEARDTGSIRWFDEGLMPLIATTGYAGAGRLWNKDGTQNTLFLHEEKGAQVNQLNWDQSGRFFLTAAEDGRTLLWTRSGEIIQELSDRTCQSENASFRYTALFTDDNLHIVTSGISALNIWTKHDEGNYLPLSRCLPLGPDMNSDTRTVPGDVQIISWQNRKVILSAASLHNRYLRFFELNGDPSKIWTEELTAFDATAFHEESGRLALLKGGILTVNQLEDNGFVKLSEGPIPEPTALAMELSWSPDGRFLALLLARQKVKLFAWQESESRFLFVNERGLTNDGGGFFNPFWTDGGFGYFDKGALHLTDLSLNLRLKVSAFEGFGNSALADYHKSTNTLAVQMDGEVKILPLDLERNHKTLCETFQSYLENSSDFEDWGELTPEDRLNCSIE